MSKIKIISVSIKQSELNVGQPAQYIVDTIPVAGASAVERINHHKHAYNSGFQGDFPCYAVHFTDGVRRLIPVETVGLVDVANLEEGTTSEDGPELPE